MFLKVKKVTPDAILPSYAHAGDAGMDMYANESITLKPGQMGKIKSGIAVEVPEGYVGLFWEKSGLSINHGIKILGGVLDSGFRGEIVFGVINLGPETYTIEKGHKVLQMLIQPVERVHIVEEGHERGDKGLGSTGK